MANWLGEGDPYTRPELGSSALLVIDTQVDFVDGGAYPIAGTTEVLPAIDRLLEGYRAAERPIVHVVRLYRGDDVDLPRRAMIAAGARVAAPGSTGSQIVPVLRPAGAPELDPDLLLAGWMQPLAPGEWAIWKPRWGAFHRTPLEHHLRALGVSTVVIAGCNYPNCPRATLYGASERDYRVLLVADAVSGVQPHHIEEAGHIGVVAATTEQTLVGLRTAGASSQRS